MPSEAREILNTFSARELKEMAAAWAVDVAGCKSKSDYVRKLGASAAAVATLRAPEFRVRPILMGKNGPQLQNLASELRVDVKGITKKADIVARIAASPAAVSLLGPPAPPPVPPPPPEGLPSPPPGEPSKRPNLAHASGDALLARGRNQDVDFGLVEDILDQARMRFEERNYDRSLDLVREALVLSRGTLDAFEKSAWAYALLASQSLIEESGRVGRDVEPAAGLLLEAKAAYAAGNLGASADLLGRLQSATKALYSEEVQRLRQVMYAVQDQIAQSKNVGADTAAADESLTRARDRMQRGEHAQALNLVHESDRLAEESLHRRVREIEAMIPATEKAIEDARHVGADVDEAARLLEKAKVAIQRREYVLAAELVQRAERASLQSQHYQIQKAMELRMRQIEKAQKMVAYLVPIVDEAAAYDLPIEEPKRLLVEARRVLDEADYVNGTMLAKQAEDVLRPTLPKIVEERGRRGIVKPPPGSGRCGSCASGDVAFQDDGWAKCNACGELWRWRAPSGLWERFRSILRE
ncbi:MAG TPA: hypothetical protein VGR51_03060 [Thermoplasmata archaeon]|nr:hypothetical protein [Thermoplasmata archaeon]